MQSLHTTARIVSIACVTAFCTLWWRNDLLWRETLVAPAQAELIRAPSMRDAHLFELLKSHPGLMRHQQVLWDLLEAASRATSSESLPALLAPVYERLGLEGTSDLARGIRRHAYASWFEQQALEAQLAQRQQLYEERAALRVPRLR